MKISRVRHVIITSIIFLFIIIIIVALYESSLTAIKKNTVDKVYRVVATRDIEPGEEINEGNVIKDAVYNSQHAEGMLYRLYKEEPLQELVDGAANTKNDDLWAIGKVAKEKIYKGEFLLDQNLTLREEIVPEETRLYAIPFDSESTGGYNVELGKMVDICLLYDDKSASEYQSLPDNKAIDIVLAGKLIADIRDETGASKKNNAAVVPGYICFNLT